MYAPFFGLQQEAFSIAPDPRFLHLSAMHREALAHLLYGLQGGGGFVLLTGEIGTGKTTVCRCFLEQIPPGHQVAYIYNPKLTPVELLQTVCQEFGITLPDPPPDSLKPWTDALNRHLLAGHAAGQQFVLIVDEAQALSAELLELLRLLTNLETQERKLLQIVLVGQPELRDLLARPELEQLAQRVIARVHLGPMQRAETADYVRHRLGVAGLTGEQPFSDRALALVHRLSGGVPRRINLLCQRALLGAYASGTRRIGPAIVRQAASEVFAVPATGRSAVGGRGAGPAARRGGRHRSLVVVAGVDTGPGAPPQAGAAASRPRPGTPSARWRVGAPATALPPITDEPAAGRRWRRCGRWTPPTASTPAAGRTRWRWTATTAAPTSRCCAACTARCCCMARTAAACCCWRWAARRRGAGRRWRTTPAAGGPAGSLERALQHAVAHATGLGHAR
jgi:general secretion pathway protein A